MSTVFLFLPSFVLVLGLGYTMRLFALYVASKTV